MAKLRPREARALLGGVLRDRPHVFPKLPETPRVLFISDYGARGLAGPSRPGDVAEGTRDFVNFVYMIGETKDGAASGSTGGTYGYGRSSYFGLSRCRTVLIHTHAQSGHGVEPRFVGISWLRKHTFGGKAFTGRTWWGRKTGDWTGPVVGKEADDIAAAIGLQSRRKGPGTTIAILDPDLEDREEAEAVDFMESCMLWNCWPRLVSGELRFQLYHDTVPRSVSDPNDHPRVRLFVKSMQAVDSGHDADRDRLYCAALKCKRPKGELGRLALARGSFSAGATTRDMRSPAADDEPLHHVALMRSSRLVVRYEVGALPEDGTQYAGVFLANPDLEHVFAASEPPSHDEWVKERLSDSRHRTFVNVTFKRIAEAPRSFVEKTSPPVITGAKGPLGGISEELGKLLHGSQAEGARRRAMTPPDRRSTPAQSPSPSVDTFAPVLRSDAKGPFLEVPFKVIHMPGAAETRVRVRARALIEGARPERDPPVGAAGPTIERWELSGRPVEGSDSDELVVPSRESEGSVFVRQPTDCAVRVTLAVAAEAPRE